MVNIARIISITRLKLRIDHEFDSVVKNSIELKRAMFKCDATTYKRNIKQLKNNLDIIAVLYEKLKKERKKKG